VGLSFADALTTVSPNYATEILMPELGFGMDGVLRSRGVNLHGILNGADYAIWDPSRDPHLPHNYSPRDLAGKRPNKAMLRSELGLDEFSNGKPLIAWMSRLAHQKMPDIALQALPGLLDEGAQFALVAEGDRAYEAGFRELAARYPGQVAVKIGYEEPLGHRLLAGADMLLHPARYEPCGLSPIYAMRYGTVPIVRRTGGLANSVVDASEDALRQNRASGFSFDEPTATALAETLHKAVSLFGQPLAWRKIQANAMRQDFSWQRSAEAYLTLYNRVLGRNEARKARLRRKVARLSA
jgi:starch synthase